MAKKISKPGRPPKHILKQLVDIEKELAQSKEKEGIEEGNQPASILSDNSHQLSAYKNSS